MKYTRLTREQFHELHQEFIRFLATQSITAAEWETIKKNKPEVAEQELDVFSDLIWEGALQQAKYLDHYNTGQLFLFHLEDEKMHVIIVTVEEKDIDLATAEGLEWLGKNIQADSVSIRTGSKPYSADANSDVFGLIQQGAVISNGELYIKLKAFIG